MPATSLAQGLLLPELRLLNVRFPRHSNLVELHVEKTTDYEVCPRCATVAQGVYDRRWVTARDAPLRAKQVVLRIRKRRFRCPSCRKVFTEPVRGLRKWSRTTERYRKSLLWACETFSDLSAVRHTYRCSAGFLYKNLYAELERRQRTRESPWPAVIGIDEHYFRRNKRLGIREFASVIVDYKGRRVKEVVEGRSAGQLSAALGHIPGRENVQWVVLDLSDPFKHFARSFFPNAQLVADKFHVLRLLNPAINRARKAITGDRRSLPIRRWLLTSGKRLARDKRARLLRWLNEHPKLNQLYHAKESLHGFYRIKGYNRAAKVLTKITDTLALSDVPELQTLRHTLMRWRNEILAYFRRPLTNGRTEGFNNKAKVVKRRAYGYKSFRNYRLRLLNACAQKESRARSTLK